MVHEYEPLDCSFACLQTTDCQSYNLREESTNVYECELSNSTKTLHPNDFKVTSGVTYYGTDTFPGVRIKTAGLYICNPFITALILLERDLSLFILVNFIVLPGDSIKDPIFVDLVF